MGEKAPELVNCIIEIPAVSRSCCWHGSSKAPSCRQLCQCSNMGHSCCSSVAGLQWHELNKACDQQLDMSSPGLASGGNSVASVSPARGSGSAAANSTSFVCSICCTLHAQPCLQLCTASGNNKGVRPPVIQWEHKHATSTLHQQLGHTFSIVASYLTEHTLTYCFLQCVKQQPEMLVESASAQLQSLLCMCMFIN